MPASSGVGIVGTHIESSLRVSLGNGSKLSNIDQKLISSSKKVLLHSIDFEKAENNSNFQLDSLRSKYKPLNSSNLTNESSAAKPIQKSPSLNKNTPTVNGHASKPKVSNGLVTLPNDGIPKPETVLFHPDRIELEWKQPRPAWVGLRNTNNNCYLNSVLQCLTFTPPLANYIDSNDHVNKCKQTGFCMMCELQRHIRRCFDQHYIPGRNFTISPQAILGKIKMIAKHLSYDRQEDAHEFLRYVVEAMQKSCLYGHSEKKLDRFSKDTTVVNQIFGGYLRSQVMCLRCKGQSNTYDPLLDISLDIESVNSVHRAFERFVQPETLDNDNAYNCPKCKTKVPAQKRFSVHRAPNILTVQLKRFDYNRMCGGKISRQIMYQEKLDLRPYMSHNQGPSVMYQLYAVLTHVGHSAGSGHYYCHVRAPNRQWYTMDDARISRSAVQHVLSTEAYLLFYCRIKPEITSQPDLQKPMIGPKLPPGHKFQTPDKKPVLSNLTNDSGVVVSRKESKPGTFQKIPDRQTLKAASDAPQMSMLKPSSIPMANQREKVSFGLTKPKQTDAAPISEKTANPPRIVMHIKNGKVFLPGQGKDESGQKKTGMNDAKTKLVPYNDDTSNSEEEETLVIKPPAPGSVSVVKDKKSNSSGVVFDKRLNATTVVPGSYKPLDTGLQAEDKLKAREGSPSKRFTSPLGKSVSDSQSVVANSGSQHKVNATTSSDKRKSVGADTNCNGWTVLTVKTENPGKKNGVHASEKESFSSKPHKELNITIRKQPNSGGWESKPKNSELFMAEFPDIKDEVTPVPEVTKKSTENLSHSDSTTARANGHTNSGWEPSDQKKHKKKKKHKRHHSNDNEDGQVNGCGAAELLNMMKKKKKDKHGDREQLLSTSDSDSSRKGSKRSSSSDDTDDSHPVKHRRESNGDDDNYVWVEKTRETMEKERSQKKEVPVQSWDYHIKDSYKRTSEESTKPKSSWDAKRSKSDIVVSEMRKMSFRGYGDQVSSWDAGKSSLDHEADRDRRHERKRQWSEDYEEELDRGKTKKVRSHGDGSSYKSHGYSHGNPFQKLTDMRREGNDRDWRPLSKYERNDRQHYQSQSYYAHDNYHRDGYRNHNGSHFNSYRDKGYHGGNRRHERYH